MCALEKRSLTCIEKIWQADHAPGGFPTLHTHTISYTIFLYAIHTYLKWSAKAPPIVYSQHTASSSSDCDSWSFFGFIQQVDAARYTMLIIYLSFVCFVCHFCDRFVCRLFPPVANRNIRLKFHMTWLIRELCSTSFKVVDGVKELRRHKETAEGHKIHIIATLVDLERPN